MATFTPIFDRVLISRDEVANIIEKTKSGIYVPEAVTQVDPRTGKMTDQKTLEMNTGTILAIGDTVTHPLLVPGARVYFGKHAGAYIHPQRTERKKQLAQGQEPQVEDEKLFVCAEADIIGVFQKLKNEETPHE